ncbi:MAG: phage tail protein, partial [Bacteroidota bacterium]
MADQNADLWPIPKFFFKVDLAGEIISFQEVTGLKLTTEMIEYRHGDDQTFTKKKMPGLRKFDNVTLKKGVFRDDTRIYAWYNLVHADFENQRKDVTVQLLGD